MSNKIYSLFSSAASKAYSYAQTNPKKTKEVLYSVGFCAALYFNPLAALGVALHYTSYKLSGASPGPETARNAPSEPKAALPTPPSLPASPIASPTSAAPVSSTSSVVAPMGFSGVPISSPSALNSAVPQHSAASIIALAKKDSATGPAAAPVAPPEKTASPPSAVVASAPAIAPSPAPAATTLTLSKRAAAPSSVISTPAPAVSSSPAPTAPIQGPRKAKPSVSISSSREHGSIQFYRGQKTKIKTRNGIEEITVGEMRERIQKGRWGGR